MKGIEINRTVNRDKWPDYLSWMVDTTRRQHWCQVDHSGHNRFRVRSAPRWFSSGVGDVAYLSYHGCQIGKDDEPHLSLAEKCTVDND